MSAAEEEEDRLALAVEETGATESARLQESAAANSDGVAAVLSIVEEALEAEAEEEEEDRLALAVEETEATESARLQESAAASLDGVAAVLSIVEEALEACKEA